MERWQCGKDRWPEKNNPANDGNMPQRPFIQEQT
jgi:hypothetical protein